jgi:hypothetical protein
VKINFLPCFPTEHTTTSLLMLNFNVQSHNGVESTKCVFQENFVFSDESFPKTNKKVCRGKIKVNQKNVKYEKHWIWEQNFKNDVTGVTTLDTEDYFKKERICKMENVTATFIHLVSCMTATPISLSCMMMLNVSYNLLNVTGIK